MPSVVTTTFISSLPSLSALYFPMQLSKHIIQMLREQRDSLWSIQYSCTASSGTEDNSESTFLILGVSWYLFLQLKLLWNFLLSMFILRTITYCLKYCSLLCHIHLCNYYDGTRNEHMFF